MTPSVHVGDSGRGAPSTITRYALYLSHLRTAQIGTSECGSVYEDRVSQRLSARREKELGEGNSGVVGTVADAKGKDGVVLRPKHD
jgi:hypothetical protein